MSIWNRLRGGKSEEAKSPVALVRVRSRLLNAPLAIELGKLEVLVSSLGDRIDVDLRVDPDKVEARHAQAAGRTALTPAAGPTVALIPVHGTLVHRSMGMLDDWSGLTSYTAIRRSFDAALADPAVREIVFDIDSGGGECAGLEDLVTHLVAARGTKPVTAIINEYACSAAYWLASAADHIIAPRSAVVGSIGVVAMHVDQSEYDAKRGIKPTLVHAGAHKVDHTPHAPLNDAGRAWLQTHVDALYEMFVDGVAGNRGLEADAVRATEAQVYLADAALAIGLIDEVASASDALESILARVARGDAPPAAPSPDDEDEDEQMSAHALDSKLEADVEAEAARRVALKALTSVAVEGTYSDAEHAEIDKTIQAHQPVIHVAPVDVAARVAEAIEAERAKAAEITGLCESIGVGALARKLIASGASLEQAREQALHLAALSGPEIIGGVDPLAEAGSTFDQGLSAAIKRHNEKRTKR